jgi:hypothetical protein
VRRLAAADMHGAYGSMRRRRIILAEFVFGAVASLGIGGYLAASAAAGTAALGWYVLGVGVNYVALAANAVDLSRPGVLDRELAEANLRADVGLYTRAQFLLFVPLLVAALAVRPSDWRTPTAGAA